MKEGKIFVITGCSGAGKTEIAKMILKIEELRLQKVVTCTSRLPRDGEEDGKDYFFLNEQEFKENIEGDKMFEWAKVYDRYYGSRKEDVEDILRSGKNVLFVIDVQGAIKIKENSECKTIFISVESLDELKLRLIGRATDSLEVIERRMEEAKKEILSSKSFDKVIVNRNGRIDEAVREVSEFILNK